MTNSTVSSESAPRSSTKEAVGVTSPSSTPSCSTIICLTFSSTAAMFFLAQNLDGTAGAKGNPNCCCRLRSNEPECQLTGGNLRFNDEGGSGSKRYNPRH